MLNEYKKRRGIGGLMDVRTLITIGIKYGVTYRSRYADRLKRRRALRLLMTALDSD